MLVLSRPNVLRREGGNGMVGVMASALTVVRA
jgi:hypothetical protein